MKVDQADQLSADLESGWTLPSSWYHDAEIYELERRRIFERSWQYIGRVEDLKNTGDYLTVTVGDVPVVALRNDHGDLAGFVNVCCHRLAEVVQGSGHRGVLQCHYHAWTYNLDGQLVSAPRSEREACFDVAEFCLQPVRVESFGPFVFANVSSEGPSLAESLGDLQERMVEDGLNFDELVSVERTEWEVAAQLEGRGRELRRVLPLRRRPPELHPAHGSRPRELPARGSRVDFASHYAGPRLAGRQCCEAGLRRLGSGAGGTVRVPLAELHARPEPGPTERDGLLLPARQARSGPWSCPSTSSAPTWRPSSCAMSSRSTCSSEPRTSALWSRCSGACAQIV